MIELIFVIVILGILAAVAIPKLAATRDDAKLASVKTDIGSVLQAVPAWYQGQKDARLMKAIQLDTTTWEQPTAGTELYTWSDGGNVCVTLAVVDMNISATPPVTLHVAVSGTDYNATDGSWMVTDGVPALRLIKGTIAPATGVVTAPVTPSTNCNTLWDDMGVTEQNISMAGKRVKW